MSVTFRFAFCNRQIVGRHILLPVKSIAEDVQCEYPALRTIPETGTWHQWTTERKNLAQTRGFGHFRSMATGSAQKK